jgi:hypothetical protein
MGGEATMMLDAGGTERGLIADLRHRYCWAYDEGDADGLGSLFAPDGVVDLGDWGVFTGTAEIVEGFRGQVAPPGEPRTTLHTLSVPVIDIDGDTATGRWYVVVYHPPREGDPHPIRFVGRYFDSYRRIEGRWLFASVRLEQFWFAGY